MAASTVSGSPAFFSTSRISDSSQPCRLVRGETSLKIHGQDCPVQAEIVQLDTMSAHGDYAGILDWLRNFRAPPRKVFITHGEPAAVVAMRQHITETFGWPAVIPAQDTARTC